MGVLSALELEAAESSLRGAERCAGFFDVIDPLKDLVAVEQLTAPQAPFF